MGMLSQDDLPCQKTPRNGGCQEPPTTPPVRHDGRRPSTHQELARRQSVLHQGRGRPPHPDPPTDFGFCVDMIELSKRPRLDAKSRTQQCSRQCRRRLIRAVLAGGLDAPIFTNLLPVKGHRALVAWRQQVIGLSSAARGVPALGRPGLRGRARYPRRAS